ncbi:MAG: hypothetical protein K8T90_15600 [Planctomycetes bacterium]|nr:hypothetical protein [Planctomycetota bacterium]
MPRGWTIDYHAVVARAPEGSDLAAFLGDELPWLWLDAYAAMTPHAVNVQRLTGGDGHEYLFDFVDQLIQMGVVAAVDAAPTDSSASMADLATRRRSVTERG